MVLVVCSDYEFFLLRRKYADAAGVPEIQNQYLSARKIMKKTNCEIRGGRNGLRGISPVFFENDGACRRDRRNRTERVVGGVDDCLVRDDSNIAVQSTAEGDRTFCGHVSPTPALSGATGHKLYKTDLNCVYICKKM